MPEVISITSRDNPFLKKMRRAARQEVLPEEGEVLVESLQLLEEAVRSGATLRVVMVTPSMQERAEASGLLRRAELVCVMPEELLADLSTTVTNPGMVGVVAIRQVPLDPLLESRFIVVLDGLQDPGNVGAILRTAEALGVEAVLLTRGCVNPYAAKVVRASAGSLFRMPLFRNLEVGELAQELAARQVALWAAEAHGGSNLEEVHFRAPLALAIGNEARGISAEWLHQARGVRIPTQTVESLNAAVAAGILLYEVGRQLRRRREL